MVGSRHRGAFTMVEMVTVLSLVAILIVLSMGAFQSARTRTGFIQCVDNGRRIGSAWTQWCAELGDDDAVLKKVPPLEDTYWRSAFLKYEVRASTWICPKARQDRDKDSKVASDYFFTGLLPWVAVKAVDKSKYYSFVEKYPNHDGVFILVGADGRASFEDLEVFSRRQ